MNTLPSEIVEMIISFVDDPKTFLGCSFVSRQWKDHVKKLKRTFLKQVKLVIPEDRKKNPNVFVGCDKESSSTIHYYELHHNKWRTGPQFTGVDGGLYKVHWMWNLKHGKESFTSKTYSTEMEWYMGTMKCVQKVVNTMKKIRQQK
jgi:hypothetical protein